jgi:hypothetical protein
MALEIEIARVCHHARGGTLDAIEGGAVDSWQEPPGGLPSRLRFRGMDSPPGGPSVALEKCALLQARWRAEREAGC